ncbi:hypothetical protein [Bacillus altitudinis]|uniref:hypothetical protein n=1 Tax=Bacillus altitudinis TaxID=293387 RepID=UPI0030C7F9BD
MEYYNKLIETLKEIGEANKKVTQSFNLFNNPIQISKDFSESIRESLKQALKNLSFPEISFDYEQLEKIANHNARCGWTMTGDTPINFYLDEKLLNLNQKKIDALFVSFYENENFKEIFKLKEVLLEGLNSKWHDLVKVSIDLYFTENYRISIPTLITIIEGEIGELLDTLKYGSPLMKEFKGKIDTNDKFLAVASYSVFYFFKNNLFKNHDFNKKRRAIINRNWVLHGKDDPEIWNRLDVLRLLNTLASIQFMKTMKTKSIIAEIPK